MIPLAFQVLFWVSKCFGFLEVDLYSNFLFQQTHGDRSAVRSCVLISGTLCSAKGLIHSCPHVPRA